MKFSCWFIVVLACLEGVLPQNDIKDTRIIGGHFIDVTEAPYQVMLTVYVEEADDYATRCGGSLISPSVVLSAAHCLAERSGWIPASLLLVYAGITVVRNPIGEQVQYSGVAWYKIHEDFISDNPSTYNDIAFIKLKHSFRLNDYVQTIKVSDVETNAGTGCLITGWGATENTNFPGKLGAAVVPVYDKVACNNSYGGELRTGTICAGYHAGGVDTCYGDSGGPLVCNGLLTGITSFGNGCAEPDLPGIYTEVRHYVQWIERNAEL